MAPGTRFRVGTTKSILAAHCAGLEFWAGEGARLWATDEQSRFHHLCVFRPKVGPATVQHDCRTLRQGLTTELELTAMNVLMGGQSATEALRLVLTLPSWDCDGLGPILPIDDSLLEEAIAGFDIAIQSTEDQE